MKTHFILLLFAIMTFGCSGPAKKETVHLTAKDLNEKGTECLMRFREDSALSFFNQALALDSSFYAARSNKIALLIRQKQFEEGQKESILLTQHNPNLPEAWTTSGLLHDITGDSVAAQKCYSQSIALFDRLISDPAQQASLFNNRLNRAFSLILVNKEMGQMEMMQLKSEFPHEKFPDSLLTISQTDILHSLLQ